MASRTTRGRLLVAVCLGGFVQSAWGVEASEVPAPPATYAYKGRQVSAGWLDQQYAYFKDKIACIDGVFFDIGKGVAQIALARSYPLEGPACFVTTKPPAKGEVRVSCFRPTSLHPTGPSAPGATVLQVIGTDQAIITSGRVLFHVRGIDPEKHIDGARFWEMLLVYVGTYQYSDTLGARRTVQSFVVYEPITREQFIQALADGFALVRYRTVTKKVPGGGDLAGVGNGFSPPLVTKRVMVEKHEIVGYPVAAPPGPPVPRDPPVPPGTETRGGD